MQTGKSEEEKKELIDYLKTENGIQIMESFLCPVNRKAYKDSQSKPCTDEDLPMGDNPGGLIFHYCDKGGAEAFREKRKKNSKESTNVS